jgi:hypothetical protein
MGLMPLGRVLSWLRTSRDTLERRAQELGVALHVRPQVRKPPPLAPDAPPPEIVPLGNHRSVFDRGDNPYRNEPDHLLSRLLEEHGDRRYESLPFRKGK